jgi:hypothetical protein
MSMLSSGQLPILILFLVLLYWLWRVRSHRSQRTSITEAGALARIERRLPPVWADLWTGRELPRAFRLGALKKPRTYFLDPVDLGELIPGLVGFCPLVERNGEAIIGWLPDGRFVQFYYEDGREGDSAITVLGRNYQAFVLSLLMELEECGMRDELVEFASALRFAHTAELVTILDREIAGEEALAVFRDRISADRDSGYI